MNIIYTIFINDTAKDVFNTKIVVYAMGHFSWKFYISLFWEEE